MVKQRVMIALTTGAVVAGLGVTSALADNSPGGAAVSGPSVAVTTTPPSGSSVTSGDVQQNEQGTDEQGAANDVGSAADAVMQEAGNQGEDDQSGDDSDNGDTDNNGDDGDNGDQQSGD